MYLYLYVNQQSQLFLEYVHYTNGEKPLGVEKVKVIFPDQTQRYYLYKVKAKENGLEYGTIETNSTNFLSLFRALQNNHSDLSLELIGKNGIRKEKLPLSMLEEINAAVDLYLSLSKDTP